MQVPVSQQESPYEASRQINNLICLGTITVVRHEKPARCRVRVNGQETDWIPWLTLRAGGDKQASMWWPPVVGEQVLLLSPGGDLSQAVVLPAIYSDAMAQKSESPGQMLMTWGEADYMQSAHGNLTINILETQLVISTDSITMKADGGTLRLDRAGLTVTPEVQVGPIKLTKHKHAGVTTGPQISAEPVP